jgi:hypothetical protein
MRPRPKHIRARVCGMRPCPVTPGKRRRFLGDELGHGFLAVIMCAR